MTDRRPHSHCPPSRPLFSRSTGDNTLAGFNRNNRVFAAACTSSRGASDVLKGWNSYTGRLMREIKLRYPGGDTSDTIHAVVVTDERVNVVVRRAQPHQKPSNWVFSVSLYDGSQGGWQLLDAPYSLEQPAGSGRHVLVDGKRGATPHTEGIANPLSGRAYFFNVRLSFPSNGAVAASVHRLPFSARAAFVPDELTVLAQP